MPIRENIKILRKRYGLTQQELGEIAGVSGKAVSTWELGVKEPRMGAIQRIADHFGISKSSIIEDGGMESPTYTQTRGKPTPLKCWRPQCQATYDITPPEYEMVCAYRVADDDTKSIVDTALKRYKKAPASEDAGDDAPTYQAAARSGDRVDVNRVSLEEELAALPPKRKRDI